MKTRRLAVLALLVVALLAPLASLRADLKFKGATWSWLPAYQAYAYDNCDDGRPCILYGPALTSVQVTFISDDSFEGYPDLYAYYSTNGITRNTPYPEALCKVGVLDPQANQEYQALVMQNIGQNWQFSTQLPEGCFADLDAKWVLGGVFMPPYTARYIILELPPVGDPTPSNNRLVLDVNPPPPRPVGLDVSHHQGTIAWGPIPAAGKTFALIKATDGIRASQLDPMWTDPNFSNNAREATQNHVIVGAYHFARPYINDSAVDEADFFLSVAWNYIGPGFLPPALDIEDPEDYGLGNEVSNMSREVLSQWIRDWCEEIWRLKRVRPMIYTTPALTRNNMESDLARYPLWIAFYETSPGANPTSLGPWGNSWAFMQYSANGTVGSLHPVDLDAFNGGPAALNALTIYPNLPVFTAVDGGALQPPNGGIFSCQITAPGVGQLVIQGSDDLTNWTDVQIVLMTSGQGIFADLTAGAHPRRFYRVKP